jgi:hypothetical protein
MVPLRRKMMSDTVTFQNPGLIPMEAVTTMGVSVKEGETPIGFFGTGLKYAIASLLRTGQRVTLWRGLDRYEFHVKNQEVRGKEFGFIDMWEYRQEDGGSHLQETRLGFTTHLGARWEMWQVFRELHANALDEGGTSCVARLEPREGFTTIHAQGVGVVDAASRRGETFLETLPLASLPGLDVHPGPSQSLFYRGVRVATLVKASAHTYNLTTAQTLTEDRTLKDAWYADHCVGSSLGGCQDERLLETLLRNKDGYEGGIRFPSQGDGFSEIVLSLAERFGPFGVHAGALAAAEMWAKSEGRVTRAVLTQDDHGDIERAKAFLAAIGYPVEYPIIVADSLGPGVFGMAKNGTVYIARTVVDRGGNFLVSTLLEERLHLSHGFADNSRAFQDFLLDMAVKFAAEARAVALPTGRETIEAVDLVPAVVDPEEEMPF